MDCQSSGLLCPRDYLGKTIGFGCHFLLQGDLPKPGMEPQSLVSPALAGGYSTADPPGLPSSQVITRLKNSLRDSTPARGQNDHLTQPGARDGRGRGRERVGFSPRTKAIVLNFKPLDWVHGQICGPKSCSAERGKEETGCVSNWYHLLTFLYLLGILSVVFPRGFQSF